ncbi:MAG: PAS domain-containing protein [Acetobacteraceae bacterium]
MLRLQRPDDSLLWVRVDGAPVHDAAGQVIFGIIAMTDISAEREAQTLLEHAVATRTAALRRSQARIRALFEHSPIDIMVLQDRRRWRGDRRGGQTPPSAAPPACRRPTCPGGASRPCSGRRPARSSRRIAAPA